MSGWNYRIIKKQFSADEVTYDVCEVYYDEDNQPVSWIWGKHVLSQDSVEDLADVLKKIQEAMTKPVLEIVGENERLVEVQTEQSGDFAPK